MHQATGIRRIQVQHSRIINCTARIFAQAYPQHDREDGSRCSQIFDVEMLTFTKADKIIDSNSVDSEGGYCSVVWKACT